MRKSKSLVHNKSRKGTWCCSRVIVTMWGSQRQWMASMDQQMSSKFHSHRLCWTRQLILTQMDQRTSRSHLTKELFCTSSAICLEFQRQILARIALKPCESTWRTSSATKPLSMPTGTSSTYLRKTISLMTHLSKSWVARK